MTDFTWDISFQLTGTFLNTSLQQTPNVTATVTGTIVTDSDSGILQQGDFISWSFTYSAPSVGFAGSASGDSSVLAFVGNVFSASGDTLSYVFDSVNSASAPHAFFTDGTSQVAFGIDLAFHNFVQGDIQLQDASFNKLDATVTQPFQIGTEVVATLADVSVVGTSQIDLDLSAIFNVAGNVTISDNDQLVSIDLSHLLSVGGNFTLTNNGALLTIELPSLTSVEGNVTITNETSATTIAAGSLTDVSGDATIADNASATSIDVGSLTTVSGSVSITDNSSATTIDAGSLTTVSGSVTIADNTSATTIDVGSLTTVSGSVSITDNSGATTIDAGSLITVGGSVSITDETAATTIDAGSLTTVSGSVSLTDNTSAITIDLSALLQAGAIVISDNGVVTLDLSALVQAGGDVSITDNTHLLAVDLPDLTSVDGSVAITGDTSATGINLGSLTAVTGDVTINSGADATLDASALGPGGGTVELIGDNLTTTITLGSLDHLGGTLTISSADGVTLTSHAGLTELDISGTSHDDTLIGSLTAKNVIDAGAGNDLMTGGANDDSFVFDFSVSQHTEFHHDFVSLADVTSVTLGGTTYVKPALTGSIAAWSHWNAELTSWANSQPDNTGGDQFASFTNQNPGGKQGANTVGTIQLIDGYFHDHNTTVTNVAGEGFDTVTNFANQAFTVTNSGGGNDVLLFDGLSNDPTAANYWGNVLSTTAANGNTTIHVHDVADGGADVSSITLLGMTTDVASLVQKGAIQFDPGFHLT